MATVLATTFDQILPLILTQLQTVTGFPVERVSVSQSGDPEEHPRQAEQFILVRCGDVQPDRKSLKSRGRSGPVFMRRLFCVLWTRANLDEARRDLIHLTDAALGHFVYEAKLWDAMTMFEPSDGNNNWLVSQPIVPGPCTEPVRGKDKNTKFTGWLWSGLEFDVSHAMSLPTANSQNLGG